MTEDKLIEARKLENRIRNFQAIINSIKEKRTFSICENRGKIYLDTDMGKKELSYPKIIDKITKMF